MKQQNSRHLNIDPSIFPHVELRVYWGIPVPEHTENESDVMNRFGRHYFLMPSVLSVLFVLIISSICQQGRITQAATTGSVESTPLLPDLPDAAITFDEFTIENDDQDQEQNEILVSGTFTSEANGLAGTLFITAQMSPNWHVGSLTQKKHPTGPLPSEIDLDSSTDFELAGSFTANVAPEVRKGDPQLYGDLPLEEHYGTVTWSAPIKFLNGIDPQQLTIQGKLRGQVCSDQKCIPIGGSFMNTDFVAHWSRQNTETSNLADKASPFRAASARMEISGKLYPREVSPGGSVQLTFSVTPDSGWHLYAYEPIAGNAIAKPTLIVLEGTFSAERVTTNDNIIEEEPVLPGTPPVRYHPGPVTWTVDIPIPADTSSGQQIVRGLIGYQTCTDASCDVPRGLAFQTTLTVGTGHSKTSSPITFKEANYKEAENAAVQATTRQPVEAESVSTHLGTIIGFSLIGGFLLNLMPCVLPVIGLKVLAFTEQGGESRFRIFLLNLVYSGGLILVFMILAAVAISTNVAWGEQFATPVFNIFMSALVFAMALSFLGIWDIPIPGFVGSGKSAKLAAKEGLSGAFFKGIFTTLLATPCSAPFLGPVFALTLKLPANATYLIYFFIGLGMALPYLVIGIFPGLIRLLPKPGAWMETFKQLMGFLLLGTVVFLFSSLKSDYVVPTLALLVGIWFACWWIGRTPLTASFTQKTMAWLGGSAVAVLIAIIGFYPRPSMWQPFSSAALAEAQAEGKTVMVDFTANWCLNCKWNLLTAIETDRVQQLIRENGVVPLLADWTHESPEIKQALLELGSRSIPLLAIYPANRPNQPIILRDVLRESQVLEALQRAGKSKSVTSSVLEDSTNSLSTRRERGVLRN